MAHHLSAKKRIRQNEKKRAQNRFYKKTTRSVIKTLRSMTDKKAAEAFLPEVVSMIDRLAKSNQFHKNKAANLKSSLALHVQALA